MWGWIKCRLLAYIFERFKHLTFDEGIIDRGVFPIGDAPTILDAISVTVNEIRLKDRGSNVRVRPNKSWVFVPGMKKLNVTVLGLEYP